MSQVFISYSHKDKDFVQYLIYRLSERDVSLWLDEDRIHGGEVWRDSIHAALNASDAMILVVTADSMASIEVSREWQYFLNKKKPVIPVILKKTELHYQLSDIQNIDNFTEMGGFDNGFNKLIDALQNYNVTLDPSWGWLDYGTNPLDLNVPSFLLPTADLLLGIVRQLNHSIRISFPMKFVLSPEQMNYPTHFQSLRALLKARIWYQNDQLHEVSSNLHAIESSLFNSRLPHFMKKIL